MNSEGSGLGFQIQGGLASQWFESTFCALFFHGTYVRHLLSFFGLPDHQETHRRRRKKKAPEVRLELTTYRLTAGRAADCAIQDLVALPAKKPCSMRGSNPRLLAHKTNTLPTELMEQPRTNLVHGAQSWPSG